MTERMTDASPLLNARIAGAIYLVTFLTGGAALFLRGSFPHFSETVNANWFDMPISLFEMALGLWLLIKGLRPSLVTEQEHP